MLLAGRVLQSWLVSFTLAALCGESSARTTTTTSAASTHTVQVGPKTNPHQYVPSSITANVGDTIVFEFYPTNHSVAKADYDAPCVPASSGVFWSGMFNSFKEEDGQVVGSPPTSSLVVNDTEPTFFYCTAIDSCLVNGMVGVINPNSTRTFEEQYNKAQSYPYMLVPGQSMPAEGTESGTSSSTGSNAGTASSSSAGSHGLSGGVIAGIVVAGVAFVAILVALFFVLGRQRVYSQWMSSQDGRTERTARWAMFGGGDHTGPSEPWSRKSELDAKAPMAAPDIASPDTRVPFSPAPDSSAASMYGTASPPVSGGWTWSSQHHVRANIAPTELEAHPMPHQLPDTRDYR